MEGVIDPMPFHRDVKEIVRLVNIVEDFGENG
jgi:hypothetical protein